MACRYGPTRDPTRDFFAIVYVEAGVWVKLMGEELEGGESVDKCARGLERAELKGVRKVVAGKKSVHIADASDVGLDCAICRPAGKGGADDSRG